MEGKESLLLGSNDKSRRIESMPLDRRTLTRVAIEQHDKIGTYLQYAGGERVNRDARRGLALKNLTS